MGHPRAWEAPLRSEARSSAGGRVPLSRSTILPRRRVRRYDFGNMAIQRILVCLDGSERAPLVLSAATDLAQKLGGRLHLFRAVGLPPEIDQETLVHSGDSLVKTLTERARTEVAAIAAGTTAALLAGSDVELGVAWDAICRKAKELDVDLIVLGSHGYSGLDRILGTTAAKVVNHADRSVLVVRPRAS